MTAIYTIKLYAFRMVEIHNHTTAFRSYHDNLRAAYEFMRGCRYLEEYRVYIDTLDGLTIVENDGDWALAFLKYGHYGFESSK